MYLKIIYALATAVLILSSTTALSEQEQPWLDSFEYLVLAPGEAGKFKFTLTNRYSNAMENVTVRAEIYKYGSLEGNAKNITEITHAPEFKNNTTTCQRIEPESTLNVEFQVLTSSSTPSGIYFVRLWLEFDCNKFNYTMYSLGWFSSNSLDIYRSTGELPANCSGIIPESSFKVAKPSSYEPAVGQFVPFLALYLLLSLIAFFSILALVLYFKER
ncbi:MAG: hypothetical protein AB1485_09335 [Candidatus Thermoplasmatota archaeon]